MIRRFEIEAPFEPAGDQVEAIEKLVKGLQTGYQEQTLLGVTGSGKTFTIAHVIAQQQRPTLVLAPNKTLAAQFYSEMRSFFPKNAVEYFVSYYDYYQPEAYMPASDTYIEKDASINDQIEQMRLSATKSLIERRDTIIVATVSAIYGLGDPDGYLQMILHLKQGDKVDQRALLRRLADLQYTRNDVAFTRATYRVRGDTIDIFPAESEKDAVRLSLMDDEIERLQYFDPLTGEIVGTTPRLTIYPKTHYVTPKQTILDCIDLIKAEMKERVTWFESQQKYIEAQRISERTRYDMEMLVELGYCSGIENYSRYLSGRNEGEPPPTLIDYLPKDGLLVIDESHVTIPQLTGMYRGDRSRKQTLVEYGFRLPSALDNRPLRFDEFYALVPQTLYVSATPADFEISHSQAVVEQVVRPTGLLDPKIEVRPVAHQVDDLLSEINKHVLLSERVLVTTLTKRMAEDLSEYFCEHGVKVRYLHSDIDTVERVEILRDLRKGVFDVLVGINLLREGLDLPEVALVAVLDADKEGFLRSERSLIQIMGRAARHINGRVILYGDTITKSMQRAIDVTQQRREKQTLFNTQHGITPKGIEKHIQNILEVETHDTSSKKRDAEFMKSKEMLLTEKDIIQQIRVLENKMVALAARLEFEEAALLRDELMRLRQRFKESESGKLYEKN